MFVVAGVSGNVGAVVANELLAKKKNVKVIVRDAAKGVEWSKRGAEVAVGSLDDANFLTTALKNATGFFTLLPPNYAAPDFFAHQKKTADAIATAVKASVVPHVVILSSVGADLAEGTGPIKGLHYLENVLRATGKHLTAIRAGYFQENFLNSVAPAKQMGIYPNFAASADYAMPMIATKDIGGLAAHSLLAQPNKSEVIDLHGPSYSNRQVAEKLGNAIGKKLNVVDVPEAGWLEALMKGGFSKHIAEVYAEMYHAFGAGMIMPKGERMVQGTTTLDETIKNRIGGDTNVAAAAGTNPVVWFEIPVNDLARAKTFYENILDVKLELNEMGPAKMAWFPMNVGATGAAGTLIKSDGFEPSTKGSIVYFTVQDIEKTLARVTDKGGKVIQAKMSIGQHGFVAHFQDSEGNRVAIHAMS